MRVHLRVCIENYLYTIVNFHVLGWQIHISLYRILAEIVKIVEIVEILEILEILILNDNINIK